MQPGLIWYIISLEICKRQFISPLKVMGWREACELVSGVRGIARLGFPPFPFRYMFCWWTIHISFLPGWRRRGGLRQLALADEVLPPGEIQLLADLVLMLFCCQVQPLLQPPLRCHPGRPHSCCALQHVLLNSPTLSF